ncbi:MAG: hypothetical protein V4507_02020 [Verrucomicrobiota bacterium]
MNSKIVIGVGIAGHPISAAGNTWAFLQWALGFKELGWDVFLVEEISASKCLDEKWDAVPFDQSTNKKHWERVIRDYGFEDHSCLLVDGESKEKAKLLAFAQGADLFLNISGHFKNLEVLHLCRHRIYLDLDPAFTQIWSEVYSEDMNFAPHDLFFTVGPLLESGKARSPLAGKKWLGTLPLVHLKSWPLIENLGNRFTTMTHWYGYPPVEYLGEWYGNKSEEFEKIVSLPSKIVAKLEIASDLGEETEEKRKFVAAGWSMSRAAAANVDLLTYQRYIQASRGEFSVAKNGYVRSHCGWFSDRSVCYLASGRPVVLQETGWSEFIPTGKGAFAFRSEEEARESLNQVESDFETHSKAARNLAEEYFDSSKVIQEMLRKIEKSL